MLHRGERRSATNHVIRETEAEAVAFVVAQAIGLETGTSSSDYIQLHSGDKATLVESLSFIQQTSSEILGAILPTQKATGANADWGFAYSSAAVINRSGQSIGPSESSSLGSNSSRIGRASRSNF